MDTNENKFKRSQKSQIEHIHSEVLRSISKLHKIKHRNPEITTLLQSLLLTGYTIFR